MLSASFTYTLLLVLNKIFYKFRHMLLPPESAVPIDNFKTEYDKLCNHPFPLCFSSNMKRLILSFFDTFIVCAGPDQPSPAQPSSLQFTPLGQRHLKHTHSTRLQPTLPMPAQASQVPAHASSSQPRPANIV
jgi:hypothetical protein